MNEKQVRVGLIQMACLQGKQANIDKAVVKIREAAGMGAQIICLQELFSSLYFCREENYDHFSLAEQVPGPTVSIMQDLARDMDVVIIASLFEKRAQGVYHNTAAIIDAGGEYLGKYRKHHIPDDPGYYEKFYFTPGDDDYHVFQTKFAKVGALICWDQWYPEAARITCLKGAEILFYPTAIGWAGSQDEETNRQQYQAWQIVQRGHAVANGVFVVSVNRTGHEHGMNFWGGSFVSDPMGELLFQAPHHEEVVHVQELDLARIDEIRVHWPFLRDRRIDSYKQIVKRYIDS
jgi:N-carbamoylputrescine amidase